MSARNSAKAIVLRNGKLLVNHCQSRFGDYYALPGGGQRRGETLMNALKRELLEETGYTVTPMRMAAVYERISEGRDEGMCHKIYFIFECRLEDVPCRAPTERDRFQLGYEWVDFKSIRACNLFPRAIRDNLASMLETEDVLFIGSEHER